MSLDFKVINNYSQSLYKEAKAISVESKVQDQISLFAKLLQDSSSVREAMSSPIVERALKNKLVDLVATKYKFEKISKQFFLVLVKNARFNLLSQIAESYDEIIDLAKGIKSAEVTSAFELGKKEIKSIKDFLEAELNTKVDLEANVDPSLIGGVVIKYDSNLIDCSVQGALDRIEKVAVKSK